MFVAARSRPPRAGPTKIPTLSIAAATTLAALSSSGVFVRTGVYAASAGRKGVPATLTRPASTYTSQGAESANTAAAARDDEPGPEQVRSHHDEAPVVAVAKCGGERGGQRRGSPAKQPHDADRPGPALLVGVDHHRHAVGPGSDDRASPGELEAAQSPVVEHAAEGRPCLRQSFQEAPHLASIPRLRSAAGGGKIVAASPVW